MAKKGQKKEVASIDTHIDENMLFMRVSEIIENRKTRAASYANQEVTLMFWEVGHYVNLAMLDNKRAEYGKQIVTELAAKLMKKYGNSFNERNMYRMMLFAERFNDAKILPPLAAKLSWSHFIELLPLKSGEARLYYAKDAAERNYGAKELRNQISRKAYERQEIANLQLSKESAIPFNVFKDPYLLDIFGLKENFIEADLEKAILIEAKERLERRKSLPSAKIKKQIDYFFEAKDES